MEEFPPNIRKTGKSAEPPPAPRKIEQVASAEPRPKGLGRKFKETFINGDARSTRDYIVMDVIIPSIRDMISEAFHASIDRLIYGDSRRRRGGTPGGYSNTPHVDYSRISTGPLGGKPTQQPERMLSRASRARGSFEELVIPTRQAATEVLDRMYDILSAEGFVSVADLYELTGIRSSHTDMKWGWTELRGSKLAKLRQGGFLLDIPEPQPLN